MPANHANGRESEFGVISEDKCSPSFFAVFAPLPNIFLMTLSRLTTVS